jgi:cytochrome c-type biogenesis protein CcmH
VRKCLALILLCLSTLIHAAEDPDLDARVMHLSAQLRCLVCQNQSIAESEADLAQDLRREVRELLAAGKTDAQVREYLVDRYGDFVLYDPPFKPSTLLLWLGPLLLALGALGGFYRHIRQRRQTHGQGTTDADTLKQARALLADRNDTP